MILIVIPIVNAVSFEINAPDNIVQGDTQSVNVSIYANPGINGTLYLSYNNIESHLYYIVFSDASFIDNIYFNRWDITGVNVGTYSIFGNLTNVEGYTISTFLVDGHVDDKAPKILSSEPSGIMTDDVVTLEVETNEDSTCKYDTSNSSYNNLDYEFSTSNSRIHSDSVSDLSSGLHRYYVRCKNDLGYIMTNPYVIEFRVDLAPTAEVEINKDSPLTVGIYEIDVTTSEYLYDIPTLEYSFNENPSSKHIISLEGEGKDWSGYMVITEEDDNQIGTFHFKGVDEEGNVGTRITEGNLFVVDTSYPIAPRSVNAETLSGGNIRINWYYDGEDADYYKIYRLTSSGVDYVDFYDHANTSQHFVDRHTVDKVTYYYKISTVDKAGNEGPLSSEVYATSIRGGSKDTTPDDKEETPSSKVDEAPKVLPPNLVPLVETAIGKIDTQILDVKEIISQLGDDKGDNIIEGLNIKKELNNALSTLEGIKKQLEGFKESYATEVEIKDKINKVELEAKKIKQTVPKDAHILEKTDFLQPTTQEDIKFAINQALNDMGLTEDEIKGYEKLNNKKKDKVKVEVSARVVEITYMDDSKNVKTLIKKSLSYEDPEQLNDIIVVESIPKSIAEHVSEIEFADNSYEVLKEDPVVKFGFLEFDYEGEEIEYVVNKRVNIESIKESKSIVLLSLNEIVTDTGGITGLSIFSLESIGFSKFQSIFMIFGIIIILLLIVYYYFFVRDHGDASKGMMRKLHLWRLKHSASNKKPQRIAGAYDIKETGDIPRKLKYRNAHATRSGDSEILDDLYKTVKNVKLDIADKLYPVMADIHDKLEEKQNIKSNNPETDFVYINGLINKAQIYLDNNQKEGALEVYPEINEIYKSLPREMQTKVLEQCKEVHQRIVKFIN